MSGSLPLPPPGSGNRVAMAWAFASLPVIEANAGDLKEAKLSSQACLVVLITLAKHASLEGDPTMTVAYETIEAESGLSRSQVIKATIALEKMGLIYCVSRRRNRANTYRFTAHLANAQQVTQATKRVEENAGRSSEWAPEYIPRKGEKWTVI